MNTHKKNGVPSRPHRHRSPGNFGIVLAAAVAALSLSPALRANTVTSTWVGSASANWSSAANWSPNSADPSNGNAGVSDYNVIINSVTNPNFAPALDVTVTIDNLMLNTSATLSVNSATTLNVKDSPLNNSGTVTLLGNSSSGIAMLNLNNPASLAAGGTIILTDSTYSRIGGSTLTNVDNTIQGAGIFTSNVINQGTITAQNGTLTFDQNIDNTAGTLSVAANGTLSIAGTLTGSVTAAAGSQILGGGKLSNVTLNATSAWSILSGTASPALVGTFTNNGTITVLGNPTLSIATLTLDSNGVILNGGGIIILSDSTYSRISGGTLTNVNNTIQGAGQFSSNVINQGTIIAQGGTLTFNENLDNTAGTLNIAASGKLSIGGILTGSITAAAGAQIVGSGKLSNVTLNAASQLSVLSGTASPAFVGTFTNQGTITVLGNGTLGTASLALDTGGVSLTGGGTIILTDSIYSRISGGTLTNVNNTIEGAGHFGSSVINQGTIIAQGGTLTFDQNIDNTAGTLSIAADGILAITGTLTGSISAVAGAKITGSGTLSNATLNTASAWSILAGAASPKLFASFTNKGTITLLGDGTSGTASLSLDTAGVSLGGGGTIILSNAIYSRITGGTLTNVDNTIQGAGHFGSNVVNQGSIIATGGTLTFDGTADNTSGALSVSSTGILAITGTLTGGTINFDPGSQLVGSGSIASATITGTLAVSAGSFNNVTLAAAANLSVLPGSLQIAGTFTNQGTVTLMGDSAHGTASLSVAVAGATLNGGGTIVLSNATYSRITGGTLTNTGNTIRGAGHIASVLTNDGTLIAEGGTLSLDASVDNTAGTITVSANAALAVSGTLTAGTITTDPTAQITGGGTLSNVTLSNTSVWNLQAGVGTPSIVNTFTNNGAITILGDPTHGVATLAFQNAGVTLNGGGSLTLTNATYSRITAGNLTNTDNTITGTGNITLSSGTFNNAGTFNFAGTLQASENINNSGTFTQSGPQSWTTGSVFTNNAGTANFLSDPGTNLSITLNAGAVNFTGAQHLQTLSIVSGTASLTATPVLAGPIAKRNPSAFALVVNSLAITGGATPAGKLNLNNNILIIKGAGAAGRDAVEADIAYARHNGLWDQNGITSTNAQAAHASTGFDSLTLGDILNSDLATPYGTFGGQSVAPSDVLVKFTYGGDANLNGVVNGDDYFQIDQGFVNHYTGWINGDFNHDGVVNGDDYFIIDSNFINQSGQLAASEVFAHEAQFGPSYLSQFTPAQLTAIGVPEPASLTLLGLAAATLLYRRRPL